MCFFPNRFMGRGIPTYNMPKTIPKKNKMQSYKITLTSELEEKTDLEINEFLNNIKETFEKVTIISIENLQMRYDKYHKYTYRVKFYHDLYLKF
jgi:hypothetical protein